MEMIGVFVKVFAQPLFFQEVEGRNLDNLGTLLHNFAQAAGMSE
jgi:hypothetical protein